MSVQFAILGILSWKPSTGYELKKMFEESSFMYWSGNNNQIYKALLQLQEEELVTSEVIHQDRSPSKKRYTVTEHGLEELKKWILSTPEIPELKKQFLIQFAWSDLLSDQELNGLLSKYENELKMQLLMQQEKWKRAHHSPNRSTREIFLWDMIHKNCISSYRAELDWVQEVRQKLFENQVIEEKSKMNYQIIETNNKKYVEFISTASPICTENDALDLVALCGENDTNLLMIHYTALSEDFFKLKTRVAGNILQKFINYGIKAAIIVPDEIIQKGRFREMAIEASKSNHLRMYESKEESERWLLK